MTRMAGDAAGARLARLSLLLAASCLGTGAALLGGRALLEQRPPLTPLTPEATLARVRRWSPDPGRRREASLLLASRLQEPDPAKAELRLLRGQGWGRDVLAALVLKRQALARQQLSGPEAAEPLWSRLHRRFPGHPADADALYALAKLSLIPAEPTKFAFISHGYDIL